MGTWLWQVPTDRQTLDENLTRLMGVLEGHTVQTLDDFLGLVHPDDRAATAEAFRRSASEGSDLLVEFRVTRQGSARWLRDRGEAFKDASGAVLYVTGACVDVTERRAMEDELRRSHDELESRVRERTADLERARERALQAERLAAISQTVATLAHEGRNALQRADACLHRLNWRLADRPEEQDLARRAQQGLADLNRLFDDIRGYAAPVRLDRRPCDLARLWRESWAEAISRHGQRDARLEEAAGSADPICEADPFRLGQVFLNLFANALDACPDPAVVTVSCREADLGGRAAVWVSVRDNGPGFSPEQRAHAFEPFRTTKPKGTGLGMAICRRVVEAHGGTIELGEGGGAEVVVTLQRAGGAQDLRD
jgi:signal transduction histidine kinase